MSNPSELKSGFPQTIVLPTDSNQHEINRPVVVTDTCQVQACPRPQKLSVRAFQLFEKALAEALGLGLICFSIVLYQPTPDTLSSAAVVGTSFAVAVWIAGPISGGHVNPIVSLAIVVTRRMPILHFLAYVVAQFTGAILGALIGGACMAQKPKDAGVSQRIPPTSLSQCIGLEIVGSMFLVMSVLSTADEFRATACAQGHTTTFPIVFGITMTLLVAILGPHTGAGMNPARSLGPAVLNRQYNEIWIYFVAPIVGSVIATFTYEILLTSASSTARLKAWFTAKDFDRSRDYCAAEFSGNQ